MSEVAHDILGAAEEDPVQIGIGEPLGREELPPRQRRSGRYTSAGLSAPARAHDFARVAGVGPLLWRGTESTHLANRVEGHSGAIRNEHVGDLAWLGLGLGLGPEIGIGLGLERRRSCR